MNTSCTALPGLGRRTASAVLLTAVMSLSAVAGVTSMSPAFADPAPIACTTDANTIACTVAGTTNQPSVTLPVTKSAGVTWPTGTFPMKSGAGTMTITGTDVTFTFSPDFLATHDAPYTYSGNFGAMADSYNYAGPFTIDVAGSTYEWNPGGYCDADCRGELETETFKSAWDNGDGTIGAELIMGSDQSAALVGTVAKIEDHAGPGQSNCDGWVNEQQADGTWVNVEPITKDKSTGRDVVVTFTVSKPTAYMLSVNCKIDGSQTTYTDAGTIGGIPVQNGTKAVWADADGNGGTEPTPTPSVTPSATASETPTPSVTSTQNPVDSGNTSTGSTARPALASTGSDVNTGLFGLGLGLTAIGAYMVRRKR